MTSADIVQFLRAQVEPIPDEIYGNRYRAAAHLKDGTYLPCVVFQSRRHKVNLACRRFADVQNDTQQYSSVVGNFVSQGSYVADWAIDRVELSPFAWPISLLRIIKGETTMGWTAFVVEMEDGIRFSNGTQFNFEFFALPDGYQHSNIRMIHSGMAQTNDGRTIPFSFSEHSNTQVLRERQHFTCFLDELEDEQGARVLQLNPSIWERFGRAFRR